MSPRKRKRRKRKIMEMQDNFSLLSCSPPNYRGPQTLTFILTNARKTPHKLLSHPCRLQRYLRHVSLLIISYKIKVSVDYPCPLLTMFWGSSSPKLLLDFFDFLEIMTLNRIGLVQKWTFQNYLSTLVTLQFETHELWGTKFWGRSTPKPPWNLKVKMNRPVLTFTRLGREHKWRPSHPH